MKKNGKNLINRSPAKGADAKSPVSVIPSSRSQLAATTMMLKPNISRATALLMMEQVMRSRY